MEDTQIQDQVIDRLSDETYLPSTDPTNRCTTDLLHFIQHSDQSTQYAKIMLKLAIEPIVTIVDAYYNYIFSGQDFNNSYKEILYRRSKHVILYGTIPKIPN